MKDKSELNKSIFDQGWSMFATMLKDKQQWRGGEVCYVRACTSQICPACKHKSQKNRKTQASFECIECGYKNNADCVEAISILAR